MTDLFKTLAAFSVSNSIHANGANEASLAELQALRFEVSRLTSELSKLKGPEALANDLGVHPCRLRSARRAAKALGIHVTQLPAFAAEYAVSVKRVISVWSKKTRAEVLAEERVPQTEEGKRLLDEIRRGAFQP